MNEQSSNLLQHLNLILQQKELVQKQNKIFMQHRNQNGRQKPALYFSCFPLQSQRSHSLFKVITPCSKFFCIFTHESCFFPEEIEIFSKTVWKKSEVEYYSVLKRFTKNIFIQLFMQWEIASILLPASIYVCVRV